MSMTEVAHLKIEHEGREVVCPVGDGPVSIGRHADNTIVIDDDRASRHHCVVERSKDGYVVRDLDSRNGTKLNEIAIRRARVESGDVIRIGQTKIHFVNPNEDTAVDTISDGDGSDPKRPKLRWTGLGWEDDDAPISIDQIPSTRARLMARDANEGMRQLTEMLASMKVDGSAVDEVELLSSRRVRLEPQVVEEDVMGQASANGARVLSMVVFLAVRLGATDIHVEPTQSGTAVRLRVDDAMRDIVVFQPRIASVVSRLIRVLADFELVSDQPVQEGQFIVRVAGREHTFWVSATPSVHGERFVLRLEREGLPPESFETFDLPSSLMSRITVWMGGRSGMLVVAGPPGSGRTTTGYALLRSFAERHLSVVSVERSVDVAVEGVSQIPLGDSGNALAMFEFVLRQGPDVVMIDDMDDAAVARMALATAARDVLVIGIVDSRTCDDASSLLSQWANDDSSAVGQSPSDSLQLIVAQRLVRVLCPSCRVAISSPSDDDAALMRTLGLTDEPGLIYRHSGCRRCHQTGYVGRRLAVGWESHLANDDISEPLLTDCQRMLREGMTTLEEIRRVL